MKPSTATPVRQFTKVVVDAELLKRAEGLNIDISKASEEGLSRAVAQRQEANWLENNQAALDSSHEYVERHGLPLARHRMF